jgi:hypothetical protein
MTTAQADHARAGAQAGAPRVLLVLESFPPALPPGGEALPEGSIWFYAACRRWGVAPDLLATARRINALDEPPAGNWYPRARARVRAALLGCRPEAVVAAGRVARSAVRGALGLPAGRLEWLEPVDAALPGAGGRPVWALAVPHFSGRSRMLNDRDLRRATSAALEAAFAAGPFASTGRAASSPPHG